MSSAAEIASKVPKLKLNDGHSIPILGLGTWQSNVGGEVYAAVKDAIDAGYRHFDCAYVYQNEEEVGKALNDAIKAGKVSRAELFVTSKLWCTFYSRERAEVGVKTSLAKLGLDYLDLYLIHWPMSFKHSDTELIPLGPNGKAVPGEKSYLDAWLGMEDIQKKGLVRSIGISNFTIEQTERLLKVATIKPVTNQVESTPFLPQTELLQYSMSKGITLTAYSPLGNPGNKVEPADAKPSLIKDKTVLELAKKHGKTAGQILLKYQAQRGIIVIPKSTNKARIAENIAIFDFELSADDMKALATLENGYRYNYFCRDGVPDVPEYPFKPKTV